MTKKRDVEQADLGSSIMRLKWKRMKQRLKEAKKEHKKGNKPKSTYNLTNALERVRGGK